MKMISESWFEPYAYGQNNPLLNIIRLLGLASCFSLRPVSFIFMNGSISGVLTNGLKSLGTQVITGCLGPSFFL